MKSVLISLAFVVSLSSPAFAKSKNANHTPPGNGRTADGKPAAYEKIYDATIQGKSLEQYFAAINGGWDKNLSAVRPSLNPAKSYLVIHSQEPKDVFDLRSPELFKKGMMSKGLKKMAQTTFGIGHVFLSWRCQRDGAPIEGTVGMTGELDNQFKKMIDNGWGLTTFTTKFTDGHLQTPALLDFEFEGEEPLHTLAIEVDSAVCGNAMAFVQKFLNHPSKPYQNFGLQMDPLKFEGGGCGSFGVTVLDQSKIFGALPIVPNLWRHLSARTSLFGYGDLELPEDSEPKQLRTDKTKKINKARLFLLSNWDGSRRDGGQKVKIMDPELLLLFLKTTYRSFYGDIERQDKALAASFRKSPLYAPRIIVENTIMHDANLEEGYYSRATGQRYIDGTFDRQSNTTVSQTRAWVKQLKDKGYKGRAVKVGKNIGVVIDSAQ